MNTVDLVLPNGTVIKQKIKSIREFANNDYTANFSNNPFRDKWWEREPKTAYAMMSAAPNMKNVGSEKW